MVNTENITLDGSIEMLREWFDPQGQGDMSDLMEEIHRQDAEADGLLVGRQTFEDLRGYWPQQTDDQSGITAHLNRVHKVVVSSYFGASTGTAPRRWRRPQEFAFRRRCTRTRQRSCR